MTRSLSTICRLVISGDGHNQQCKRKVMSQNHKLFMCSISGVLHKLNHGPAAAAAYCLAYGFLKGLWAVFSPWQHFPREVINKQ